MPHKVNPIDFENAEGNLGCQRHAAPPERKAARVSRWQRDRDRLHRPAQHGGGTGLRRAGLPKPLTGLNKLEINEQAIARTWTPPGKYWPSPSRP